MIHAMNYSLKILTVYILPLKAQENRVKMKDEQITYCKKESF